MKVKYFDQVFWVTGASSGIGKAIALNLIKQNCKVIISGRRDEALKELVSHSVESKNVSILPFDLSESHSLNEICNKAESVFSRIDVLVLAGGISQRSFAMDTNLEVDRKLMEVNYFSSVAITKSLLPGMIERKKGQIVVISSLVGKFGTPFRTGYSASKHALHGFFDSLRAEIHERNIGVCIINPGFIKTRLSFNALLGDGSLNDKMDDAQDKGMSADQFALKAVRAMQLNKREVNIGGKEIAGVYLKLFVPGIFSRIIRKAKVR